ncbi:MAG: SDR family NAD(P)-dependent oxidoreductase [Pseudomonadota bacterium]
MKLAGKHIVITGGASGIGLGLVQKLYVENEISVICRPSSALEALRGEYDHIAVHEADFADLAQVEQAADQLVKPDRKIDLLINNAAVQHVQTFLDDDFRYESIRREIDINFTSVCTLTYLLLPALLKSTPSTVLNINSGLALAPKTTSAVYCATKGAMNIFSQSLGYQLEETNIQVKQAFLPLVDTAMTKGRGTSKLPVQRVVDEIVEGLGKSGPTIDVGKVRLLRSINRLSPNLAQKIMKRG